MPTLEYFRTPSHLKSPEEINDFIRSELLANLKRKAGHSIQEVDKENQSQGVCIEERATEEDKELVPREAQLDSPKKEKEERVLGGAFSKKDGRHVDLTQEGGEGEGEGGGENCSQRESKETPNVKVRVNLSDGTVTMLTSGQERFAKTSETTSSPCILDDDERESEDMKSDKYLVTPAGLGKESNEIWRKRLVELKAYKDKLGHCNVPIAEKNPTLRAWIDIQRNSYRKLKKKLSQKKTPKTIAPLTKKRIRELEELGMEWRVMDVDWYEHFEALRRFKQEFGHCAPNGKHDRFLGNWVMNQRKNYRYMIQRKTTAMTKTKRDLLLSLGFQWNVMTAVWESHFKSLKEFKDKHGHTDVSCSDRKHRSLGLWVAGQRKQYRTYEETGGGPMIQERREKLESIEFVWHRTSTESFLSKHKAKEIKKRQKKSKKDSSI